ncbi:glycosyltransferase [Microbacterium sp. BK668]|uniref:glycosyltransferase n=1 Tax=Microbacterium sp. BK668 TaxID=2512118 RepID=UPI00105F4E19|nr:glycosyltransferase [Microbacterium sp. BK668]TDN90689.1 glycosyl transferase family 1 [Microbacterium sp. BK668]
MRVLIWHVHGGYTDAFVRGDHEYLVPVNDARDAWGLGLAGRSWPQATEVTHDALRETDVDVVVLQRPEELELAEQLTGRRPGYDLPAVYLEHNAPRPEVVTSRHPLADQRRIPIVHVTHFNELYWDNGEARTIVIEHGLPDPGETYTGDLPALGVVINEPVRRWRIAGTDLLPAFGRLAPVDVFGMGGELLSDRLPHGSGVAWAGNHSPEGLRRELGRRRLYLHPYRWTSLGLSLIEAMLMGMPVVALAATEVLRAVPPGVGVVATDLDTLRHAAIAYLVDEEHAREAGHRARLHALRRFSHPTFLARWDAVLGEAASALPRARAGLAERSLR